VKAEMFCEILGADFYTGVPDSQLKALCDYLLDAFPDEPNRHLIAANEGNAAALAAGYHLATGKVPVVYLQNSGEGNILNPVLSLFSDRVYAIPALFVVGWRGEPGVPDEPQHVHQGEVTLRLLEDVGIEPYILDKDTTAEQVQAVMERFHRRFAEGKSGAFVVRKGALTYEGRAAYQNGYSLTREEAIRQIIRASGDDPVVSTTGKASRELFELREALGQGHQYDFLTVGSMGHSSSIALGLALQRPDARVWCIDGDGAALMHMGAMAVIGSVAPKNLIHIVINNGAHESVGGMPTAAGKIDLVGIAKACGYPGTARAAKAAELERALQAAKAAGTLYLIEVRCAIGARSNLGRPTTTARENKDVFMACWDEQN